jgi:ABC-type oligopeptide transport system ATPase subunit
LSQPLLKVVNLKKHFPVRGGMFSRVLAKVKAVDGVSFELGILGRR